MTTLYAWQRKAFAADSSSSVDHTWVTDYSNLGDYDSIDKVESAGLNYWYCLGSFHNDKFSPICSGSGDLALSLCICKSNDKNARGTIHKYGIDGVCHQLANQVLISTSGPLTVKGAKGYSASSFLYGTYGANKDEWNKRYKSCCSKTQNVDKEMADDFTERARQVLDNDRETIDQLLKIREDFQNSMQLSSETLETLPPDEKASELNKKINQSLRQALEVLGTERYEELFNHQATDFVELVDPNIMKLSDQDKNE